MPDAPTLSPPPRPIPRSLRWHIQLSGTLPTIGWAILAIGGFLSTVFVSNSELATWTHFATELATVEGVVTGSEETNAQINEHHVMLVQFEYTVNGQHLRGRSFGQDRPPDDGTAVVVEYAINKPGSARIEGMRSAPFSMLAGWTLLIPLGATVLLLMTCFLRRNRLHLMQHGESTSALLTNRELANARSDDGRIYKLTFSFVDRQGQTRHAMARSHRTELFDDKVVAHVLYTNRVKQNCIVEFIPGSPTVVAGAWQPVSIGRVMIVLILPTAALAMCFAASFIRL